MSPISISLVVAAVLTLAFPLDCSATLRAQVKRTASGPVLLVNGVPTAPAIVFVNYDTPTELRPLQLSEVETAAQHGVRIVSFPIPGPWLKAGETPDFKELDDRMDQTLRRSPKALIIPRIGISWPPDWWKVENREDLALLDNGLRGMPSVFSVKWRDDTAAMIRILIDHLERNYGDHVLGYHLSALHSGEWFCEGAWEGRLGGYEKPAAEAFRLYLRNKYGSDRSLRRAWNDPSVALGTAAVPLREERLKADRGSFRDPSGERKVLDYLDFESKAHADAAIALCRVVREAAPSKLSVVFFGYDFELSALPNGLQTSGHLALRSLLSSPYVDVICAPVSYLDRGPGGGGYFMGAVDSIQLAGKLWLSEDDTRTHLAGDIPGDQKALSNDRETRGVLARNFAQLLTRGSALWWMDLRGDGNFRGDNIWQLLGELTKTYQDSMNGFVQYHPEIAVIIDQRSAFYTDPSRTVCANLLAAYRLQLYRIGAPIGLYLLDDFVAGKVPPAKMNVFLDTFRLDQSQIRGIRKHAFKKGCVNVWMYAPGIIRDGSFSPRHIGEVTGIRLKECPTGEVSIRVCKSGTEFVAQDSPTSPAFAVADERTEPLARYSGSKEVAVASREEDGCVNVYSGVLRLPVEILRYLARSAGVHIYNDQDDVLMVGNGFVSISASTAGSKRIKMPAECKLLDIVTGEQSGPADEFTFELGVGDTKIWKIAR